MTTVSTSSPTLKRKKKVTFQPDDVLVNILEIPRDQSSPIHIHSQQTLNFSLQRLSLNWNNPLQRVYGPRPGAAVPKSPQFESRRSLRANSMQSQFSSQKISKPVISPSNFNRIISRRTQESAERRRLHNAWQKEDEVEENITELQKSPLLFRPRTAITPGSRSNLPRLHSSPYKHSSSSGHHSNWMESLPSKSYRIDSANSIRSVRSDSVLVKRPQNYFTVNWKL
ncbi:unnamed protein product [Dimorphilus gyrociliatus]|uniref:Uncharacterized protein n=1 Tax=Dimorphilus gyrociliatus TaxID=2664684 RepID=A0A7I8WDL2_9ANNE|nr:unnamed protein product [Dimorphilus gyrociliatus]